MDVQREVLQALDHALCLGGRGLAFKRSTHLLGAIPELDSMAVVNLIGALEERLGIVIDDDDLDGEAFATVGSLVDFASTKLTA